MWRNVTALLLLSFNLCAQQHRGFWADAFHAGFKSPAEVDKMIEGVAAAKGNAIFAEVRRRADSYYLRSQEPPAEDADYDPGFDALQYMIDRAHARGIEVHAWFPVYPLWQAGAAPPKNPAHPWFKHGPNAKGDDMWMTIGSNGNVSTSLDPGHPDVMRYLADLILAVANNYNVDGLHLDYIRYPEDANYGWNPKAVERFQRLQNRTGSPSATDPKWADFRREQVTDLVRQLYLRSYAIRPAVKMSAAVITWGNGVTSDSEFQTKDAYSRVFQDWRGWMEEGILDLALPMNYFADPKNGTMFDRWIEYEKDRQYNRGLVIGPAIYLNTIADSLSQMGRALAPSLAGNKALGINFYSYASTNAPGRPNAEFYQAVGDYFQKTANPPALAWKAKPDRGHIYGWLTVEPGPVWLKDGATIWIEGGATGRTLRTATDGTGFLGAVDLVPDLYLVRLERGGKEIYRSSPLNVTAGTAARLDIPLRVDDFAAVMPRLTGAQKSVAAPGERIALLGSALCSSAAIATAAPLPLELSGTQAVVNGSAAAVFSVAPDQIDIQLPYQKTDNWSVIVRRDGLESQPFQLGFVDASPVILAVRQAGAGYLEIYASGLGNVTPPLPVGAGGAAREPYNRVTQAVTVLLGDLVLQPLYAGAEPYVPARYQVNVKLPDGVSSGELRLRVGDAVSESFRF